jgi:pimeloyl-ACP methyl ester carboxylesterase
VREGDVRTRTVRGEGVRLHAREWTGGPKGFLLLHGLASTARIWDLVAPRLARSGFRAVAYDQRGHGLSGKPSAGYGFEHTSADAASVIRATNLRRPIAVGHSWGANVALELADRHPRLVSGVVLLDGGFLPMRERFDWRTASQMLAPPDLAGISAEAFVGRVRSGLGRDVEMTPTVEEFVRSLVRVDPQGDVRQHLSKANHLRILRALWEQDPIRLLGRLRVPALVLAVRSAPASADATGFMQAKTTAARLVRRIERVRFEWIDGIHDVPLQRPEAVARRLVAFSRTSDRVAAGRS